MKKQVKLTFREVAEIIGTHLANKGSLTDGVVADVRWYYSSGSLEDSYIIFEQEDK